jgi:hypothetical protein
VIFCQQDCLGAIHVRASGKFRGLRHSFGFRARTLQSW